MKTFGEVSDEDGKQHLQLLYIEQEGGGWNFHSLVWQRRDGDTWQERVVITRDAFESGTDRRRWVSQIQSFDSDTGRAIVRVAEGDQPKGARKVHYAYSWREWDIAANRELRFIKVCTGPFEPFEKS